MPFTQAIQITAGSSHTCALFTSGTVRCWGRNWFGQLGDGTLGYRTLSDQVMILLLPFKTYLPAVSR